MSALTKQFALLRETAAMAFETLRGNKMRSALTVLGVVIGVTSIVGMTSLIRGFDSSLRDSISSLGPNTIFVQKFGISSFSSSSSISTEIECGTSSRVSCSAFSRISSEIRSSLVWSVADPRGKWGCPSGSR